MLYLICGHGLEQLPQCAPVLGRAEVNIFAAIAAKQQATDTVVQTVGSPAEQGSCACGLYRFKCLAGTEVHVQPLVHTQYDAAFAFLAEYLKVGFAGTRGDFPVHVADVVAFAVFAHFFEVQALATEYRGIQAAERGIHPVVGGQAKRMCLVAQFQQIIQAGLQTHNRLRE